MFTNNIKQLLHNLPLDMVTDSGELFWSGAKKAPTPADFDASSEMHVAFIEAAANLRARCYRIHFDIPPDQLGGLAAAVEVPVFEAATVKYSTNEADKTQAADETTTLVSEEDLPAKTSVPQGFTLEVAEFEKDDETNYHMDFITAVSNLRATNYQIPTEDKHKTKMIAGKIIPAMVTTTSLVTGLVGMEFLKYTMGIDKLELYKSAFINIALPMMNMSNPISCNGDKDKKYSMWDEFYVVDEGKELTVKGLVQHIKVKLGVDAFLISTDLKGVNIYASFSADAELLNKPVSKAWEEKTKQPPPEGVSYLNLIVEPESEDEVPKLRYRFRWD